MNILFQYDNMCVMSNELYIILFFLRVEWVCVCVCV